MNWKNLFLIGAATLLAFSCSLKDSNAVNPIVSAQVDPSVANQSSQVSASQTQQLLQGQPITATFASKSANLQVQQDSAQNPVLAVTASDSVTTYFKMSSTASLRKVDSLANFLQGVWVAFAQLKGGVWFELVVDTNNQITMNITNLSQGIQVDIKVQGTPSAEEVKKASLAFAAWQASVATSSSSLQIGLSSYITVPPVSSSSLAVYIGISSSSSAPIELSSSLIPQSSSLTQAYSSSVAPISSSVQAPSSSSVFAPSSSSSALVLSSSSITASSSSVSAQSYATAIYSKMIEMEMITQSLVTTQPTPTDMAGAISFVYNGSAWIIKAATNAQGGYTATFYKSTSQANTCVYVDADQDVWNTSNTDNDASFSYCVKNLTAPAAVN